KRVDEIPIIKKLKIYDIGSSGKLNAYKLFIAKSITLLNYSGRIRLIFPYQHHLSSLSFLHYEKKVSGIWI
ncbi:hypothetical protein EZS27_034236, partial [termite gut metagenome]